MPTFLKRFRRNLPTAFEEWVMGIMFLALGFIWLVFPASFYRPDSTMLLDIASARIWTTTAIMVGVMTCVALAASTESPRLAGVLRVLTNLVRLMMLGAFLGRALAASDLVSVSWGIALYGALFVLDVRHIMRSSSGTFNAFRGVSLVRPITMV